MKLIQRTILALGLLALCAGAALAADDCTSSSIKANVDKAAAILAQKGQAGLEEVKAMRFCGDQGYIYVQDLGGVMIMHPVAPHLVGKNVVSMKDANGKMFAVEMVSKVKEKGSTWFHYAWPKPGQKAASDKCGYAAKTTLDGKEVLVASGIYDIPEVQCGK